MNSKDFLKEGFIEDASDVHMDHEVQMAREECYHAAEHALAIHKLLRNISEQQGLEGWVSSKITLANDYLNTVREHLEYELLQPQIDDVAIGMPIAENEQQVVAEMDKSQDPPGRDGGTQFPPGPKTSKKDIKSLTKDPVKHLNNLFAKGYDKEKKGMAKEAEQGVAEGSLNEGQYEMMMRNGQVKKFIAKDDADAKRIAAGHGAKSVIRLKGGVPAGKVAEQGVAEGAKCNHTMEGKSCPVHGLNECPGMKARALAEWRKQQRALKHNQSVMEFAPLGAALAAGAGLATGAGLSLLKKQDPKEPSMQQRIKDKKRQEAEQRFREKMDREQNKVSSSDSKTFTQDLDLINVPESKSKLKSRKIREQGITDQEIRQRIQPTFQATDAQLNDPEWMRSRGLIPMQDIEQDLAQTKQAEVQQAQQRAGTNIRTSSGAPVIAGSKMMKETTAGSVAGVVNPKSNKPKNQIGSLFGGSYKQSRKKQ